MPSGNWFTSGRRCNAKRIWALSSLFKTSAIDFSARLHIYIHRKLVSHDACWGNEAGKTDPCISTFLDSGPGLRN